MRVTVTRLARSSSTTHRGREALRDPRCPRRHGRQRDRHGRRALRSGLWTWTPR